MIKTKNRVPCARMYGMLIVKSVNKEGKSLVIFPLGVAMDRGTQLVEAGLG
jgi:hypothetical protein